MKRIIDLFVSVRGGEPACVEKITTGAGSNRTYYRLKGADGRSMVGVVGTSEEENRAFVCLSRHFREKSLPVPEVYAVSGDGLCYLQQDLGCRSLYDMLKNGREKGGRYDEEETELLKTVVRCLPAIQFRGAEGLDFSICYPKPELDKESIFFDLNYFKYCFLKTSGIEFNEVKLEESFRLLAADLTSDALAGFMYRDFQARNVMIADEGKPYFIDFQGGRSGPCYYDVASFLWQASARYSRQLRRALTEEYYTVLADYVKDVPEKVVFQERLQLFVLFRTLQVLGAYGFRGCFERKPYFIQSIAPAIDNLRELLQENNFRYAYLIETLCRLTASPKYNPPAAAPALSTICSVVDKEEARSGKLVVRVFSFSYKCGIPVDESGNGGGYVFDCRSTNNPGRYERYSRMTGLDAPVVSFLEDDGEILAFLDNVYRLADAHVERYIKRGFTSLMFSFGCTGGQHRSVYSAERLAEHLHGKYGIEVRVCHREQNICKTLK